MADERVFVVTGSSTGVGAATALELARQQKLRRHIDEVARRRVDRRCVDHRQAKRAGVGQVEGPRAEALLDLASGAVEPDEMEAESNL